MIWQHCNRKIFQGNIQNDDIIIKMANDFNKFCIKLPLHLTKLSPKYDTNTWMPKVLKNFSPFFSVQLSSNPLETKATTNLGGLFKKQNKNKNSRQLRCTNKLSNNSTFCQTAFRCFEFRRCGDSYKCKTWHPPAGTDDPGVWVGGCFTGRAKHHFYHLICMITHASLINTETATPERDEDHFFLLQLNPFLSRAGGENWGAAFHTFLWRGAPASSLPARNQLIFRADEGS